MRTEELADRIGYRPSGSWRQKGRDIRVGNGSHGIVDIRDAVVVRPCDREKLVLGVSEAVFESGLALVRCRDAIL